ncbi:MAG: hypothetical protein H0V81_10815 [Solirubrobacterales bacterium]|nr:hypothetical protein [Solirubrobacterales bacterium]
MQIDLAPIEADAELVERNQQRAKRLREGMGPNWIGHPVHAAKRKDHAGDDVRTTIARARAMLEATRQHANNVHRLKREAA